jgi:CheY-like chemotaxis protein
MTITIRRDMRSLFRSFIMSITKAKKEDKSRKNRYSTHEMNKVMDREVAAYDKYLDEARSLRISTRSHGTYLVLEDDGDLSALLEVIIKSCNRKVQVVPTIHEAVEFVDKHGHDEIACCVIDIRLPDGDGETFINLMEDKYPQVPIVVYTGSKDRVKDIARAHPRVRIIPKGIKDGVKTMMNALALPNRAMTNGGIVPGA